MGQENAWAINSLDLEKLLRVVRGCVRQWVDMTPDTISKSGRNAEKIGTKHVEFRLREIENLPVADNGVDNIVPSF